MNNIDYVQIVSALRFLKDRGLISEKEYRRAKEYYAKATGTTMVIAD